MIQHTLFMTTGFDLGGKLASTSKHEVQAEQQGLLHRLFILSAQHRSTTAAVQDTAVRQREPRADT